MRRVAHRTTLSLVTLCLLPVLLAGCSAPWIVQGGIDLNNMRRPTAFVEGNTPRSFYLGSFFDWQPVPPPTWHPGHSPDPPVPQTTQKTSWVFRESSDEGERPERLAGEVERANTR